MNKPLAALCAAALAVSWGWSAPNPALSPSVEGTWKISNWTFRDTVHMTLGYRHESTRWQWGHDQTLADLKGLDAGQLRAMSTPAKFTMERDAGVFFFEGTIMLGIGHGDFRFVSKPSFLAKLAELGYEDLDADNAALMFMAARDISLEFAEAVMRLGLARVSVEDLVRFRDHGIELAFIRDLVEAGYPGLSGEDVIKLRDHGIDGRYVARVQAAGFKDVTVDEIVRLHDHGVD